ncbi:putative MFS-type transporter [Colletotrichum orbiculare MAFF 240422]|uniref:MFS-type transporter n=1 Tax=Colletotrichum orbiculare (strain 104-T / ATCC 96160 / CBS 514.97 / LARS 414 / MAFF 240422) TaxID=1213857 RepID=A0A484G2S3_COLOR|nr:putative MFS-type transporter [Colletotrichum orbiculare MAFF 240422]
MSTTTVELVNAPAKPLPELSKTSSATSTPAGAVFPAENSHNEDISKGKTVVVISSVTCITAISSLLAGVVTVCIPAMARDVNLEGSLLLWACLGLYLLGCFFQSVFTLACGLANTGTQLIVFRAFAGVAISMCLPSAVSIITHAFPSGKRRNIAFASMGGGQPIGFSVGLSVGGVFTDTIGWRWGFHMAAIINTVIFLIALKWLPSIGKREPVTWNRFVTEVDWIGAFLASAFLSMISYVLAVITESTSDIKKTGQRCPSRHLGRPRRQLHRLGRAPGTPRPTGHHPQHPLEEPQLHEHLPALGHGHVGPLPPGPRGRRPRQRRGRAGGPPRAGRRGGPRRRRARGAVAAAHGGGGRRRGSYWYCVFWAMLTNAVGADTLFTISNLLVTSLFPSRTQGVAGGVYNTIAQIGKSVGLASSGTIASAVTARSAVADKESPPALLDGYRASFWYCFALYGATLLVTVWGLRKIGKVGVKKE